MKQNKDLSGAWIGLAGMFTAIVAAILSPFIGDMATGGHIVNVSALLVAFSGWLWYEEFDDSPPGDWEPREDGK